MDKALLAEIIELLEALRGVTDQEYSGVTGSKAYLTHIDDVIARVKREQGSCLMKETIRSWPGLVQFIEAYGQTVETVESLGYDLQLMDRPRSLFSTDPAEREYLQSQRLEQVPTGLVRIRLQFHDKSEIRRSFTTHELKHWMSPKESEQAE